MITIKTMTVSKPFRYLWLKSVEGVNLDDHCAKSLIGQYDNRIGKDIHQINDVTLEHNVYYLCGVALPYKWANNFHLAFRHKPGAILKYENNGISVTIQDAERIVFSENDVDWSLPQAKKREYHTCRNWQFANWYKNNT